MWRSFAKLQIIWAGQGAAKWLSSDVWSGGSTKKNWLVQQRERAFMNHDKTALYRTWEHTESDRSVLRVSGEIMHRGESKGRIVIILVSSSVKLPKTQYAT